MTLSTGEHWRQTAMAALARGDRVVALQALERALAFLPDDADLRSRLALLRLNQGDLPGARTEAGRVGANPKADARSLDRSGHVLCSTLDYEAGTALFRRAAALAPKDPGILRNLAWGAQYVGDFDEASSALRRAISIAPDDAMAWSTLSGLPGWAPSDEDIAALTRLAATSRDNVEACLAAGHALARAHEARGDFPRALQALTDAKAARRRRQPYDIEADLALFRAAVQAWETGPRGAGDPSSAPIFVVGPPRSGTTLMDRILSSHRDVTSAGELPVMVALALNVAGQPPTARLTAPVMLRAAGGPAGPMGDAFMRAAAGFASAAGRFVDKRPFNLILAGMISRILPNARILRIRRPAADTVVGNYRQFFNTRSLFHDYSYDLADTAKYVAGMESLSEAWEARLPADRYRVIDYPALIARPEETMRETLDFCGLDWDPACLSFHENTAAVSTASAVQVREPLHDRNLDIWRRYGPGLEPALAVLRAAGRLSAD